MDYSERRERERNQRYDEIVKAAEMLITDKGADAFTMDDVARASGFTKKTLYSYFKSKEDLNYEILYRSFTVLNSLLDEKLKDNEKLDEIEKIKTIGKVIIDFYNHHPEYYFTMSSFQTKKVEEGEYQNFDKCYTAGQYPVEILSKLLLDGINNGRIDSSLSVNKTVVILWANIVGLINLMDKKTQYINESFGTGMMDIIEYGMDLMANLIRK
jgi:AcrR family transcriptional regulator